MWSDILSPDAYGRYNRKMAKITNIECAVYWSEVLDIITKVVKKKKFDENGFFKLDRKYIEDRTTISIEQQYANDLILEKLGLVKISSESVDKIAVDLERMAGMLSEDNIKNISAMTKVANSGSRTVKAAGKRAGIISRLQGLIQTTDIELHDLYCDLLEVVYAKGLTTNQQFLQFQEAVTAYSTDVNIQKEIVRIAIARAYKVADWAIQIYNKEYKGKQITKLSDQKISTGETSEIVF